MNSDFFNKLLGKWANLHPAGKIMTLLIFAGLFGFFGLKPGYAIVKKWRIERNLTEARKAVDESRMHEARDLSLTVLQSGNSGIEAYRILEKSTAALRDPRHREIARALMFHPAGSDEDRLTGFEGFVMESPLATVGQAWANLPEEARMKPQFAAAFAKRLIAGQRWMEAGSVLLSVPEADRNSDWTHALISVVIGTGTDQAYAEAQRLIASAIEEGGADKDGLLDQLEKIPVRKYDPEVLVSVRKFLEVSNRTDDARYSLLLARLDWSENFQSRGKIIDDAIAKWEAIAPEDLGAFLCDLGLDSYLLGRVSNGEFPVTADSIPILWGAVVRTGYWEMVEKLLEDGGADLEKGRRLAYQAIAKFQLSKPSAASKIWSESLEDAKARQKVGTLLSLHRMAAEVGATDLADKAMIEAIRFGRGPLPLYADLKSLIVTLREEMREHIVLEICTVYLPIEPGNPILLTQYAYLAYFNDLADVSAVIEAIEALVKVFPDEQPLQRVLAILYVCGRRSSDAEKIFKMQPPNVETAPPEYLMAYYVNEVLAERMSAKDTQITNFPQGQLLPSERKKFAELLRAGKVLK